MDAEAHALSFDRHRALLFSVAYRMTGSLHDAEDIVQDVWFRYIRTPLEKIKDEKFFLIRLATRAAIDALRKLRREREAYKGVWLPDAVLDDYMHEKQFDYERRDAISYALLHTLEKLNPVERAAFLFRDVFDYDYRDVARILERSEMACRKLVSRARILVKDSKVRFKADPAAADKLLWAFLRSAGSGDLAALENLLSEDARLYTDGGGRVKAAILPIRTRRKVARFLIGVARKQKRRALLVKTRLNGETGFLVVQNDRVQNILQLSLNEAGVASVRTVINPDKLPQNLKIRLRFVDYLNMLRLLF